MEGKETLTNHASFDETPETQQHRHFVGIRAERGRDHEWMYETLVESMLIMGMSEWRD